MPTQLLILKLCQTIIYNGHLPWGIIEYTLRMYKIFMSEDIVPCSVANWPVIDNL